MTTGTDLVELLASATMDGPPPPAVSELRRRRRRAQRRRTVAVLATGCVAVVAGAAAVVVAVDDHRSFEVTTVDSAVVPLPTTTPASTERPPGASEQPGGGPPILLPSEGWKLTYLESTGYVAPADEVIAAVGPDGVLGPMAWIRFNAGVETLEYVDGPRTFHDTTSPAGHTVRVGSAQTNGSATAIRVVEGGSVSVTAFDVDERTLLALVDAATVTPGRVQLDPALLPAGFSTRPTGPDRTYLSVDYAMQAEDGRSATVQVSRWGGTGSAALLHLRSTPGVVQTVIKGNLVLLAPADPAGGGYGNALVLASDSWDEPGWAYAVQIPPLAENGFEATRAEIEALIASLVVVGPSELVAEVPGLEDRQVLIDRWLADVPVPASADLSVLRAGPPMSGQEAEWVYQVLRCSIVLDWAITGDEERLDEVAASTSWRVKADIDRYREDVYDKLAAQGAGAVPLYDEFVSPADLDQARKAATADERWATVVVDECTWAMALTGQRRS